MNIKASFPVPWLLVLVLLTGCATSRPVVQPPSKEVSAFLRTWLHTPYREGGLSLRGVDCSGLVVRFYEQVFHLSIPRTTDALRRTGHPVSREDLRFADLVFFSTRPLHVGIMLDRHRFLHASTSQGVMISSLEAPYWRTRFLEARRLVETNPPPSSFKDTRHHGGW